jgi:hypothetical protein
MDKTKYIHWSKLWDLMQRTDAKGAPIPFQLKFVKLKTGEVREYTSCVLTSFHSKGTTLNVLPEGESHPKTINRVTIIEFNKHRVYL